MIQIAKEMLLGLLAGLKWIGQMLIFLFGVTAAGFAFFWPAIHAGETQNPYWLLLYLIHIAVLGAHIRNNEDEQ